VANSLQLTSFQKKAVFWLSLLIMPIAGSGIYLYVPSLPAIAKELQVQAGFAELTVVVYVLGLGLPQIFFGIWSDFIGRRRLLLPALAAFFVVTFLIPFSPNIYVLLSLRFLQGVIVAVPEVLIKTLMSDTFTGAELDKNANYLVMSWSIGPILMPILAVYLKQAFGGSFPFFFLAFYGLVSFLLSLFFLPETSPPMKEISLKKRLKSYKQILSSRVFLSAIVCLVAVYSIVAIFNSIGPFLVQNLLKESSTAYGRLAFVLGISWLIGNLANRFHARRNNLDKALVYRMFFLIVVSAAMALLGLFAIKNYWALVLPMALLFYAAGLIFPRLFAMVLGLFPELAGGAAAIFGTLIMIGGSFTTGMAAFLKTNSLLPLSLTYIVLSLIFAVVYWLGVRHKV